MSLYLGRVLKKASFQRHVAFFDTNGLQIVSKRPSFIVKGNKSSPYWHLRLKKAPFQRKIGCFLLKRQKINAKSCFMSQKGFAASHSVLKNRVLFCTRGYVDLDLSLFFKKIFKHLSELVLFRLYYKATIRLAFVQVKIILMVVFSLIEFFNL